MRLLSSLALASVFSAQVLAASVHPRSLAPSGLEPRYDFPGTIPIVVPVADGWLSQGCYSDSQTNRTLERRVSVVGNMTVESCVNVCQLESFTIAGLEFAQECWCGNQISPPGQLIPQSNCTQACVGDSLEVCGGPNALEVYYE